MKRLARVVGLGAAALALAIVAFLIGSFVEDRGRANRELEAEAAPFAALEITPIGSLPADLAETSGVAVSRRQDGVLWTHNDSGDGPRLYAVRATGAPLGTWTVPDAEAHDWEALALAPCPGAEAAGHCLYVADTGDNAERRTSVTLYIVAEPRVDADARETAPPVRIDFTYPDARHDVEALAIAPDGSAVLVTKGRDGSIHAFRIPAASLARSGTTVAQPAGTLALRPWREIGRQVTGAAFSPDGTLLALRTYTEIWFFRPAGGTFEPVEPRCVLGRAERQGEAIDFLDARTLVLTSEAADDDAAMVHRVRCALLERRAGAAAGLSPRRRVAGAGRSARRSGTPRS